MTKASVGIDVSKDDFHACFKIRLDTGKTKIAASRSFKSSDKGFEEFLQWAEKNNKEKHPLTFIMEATGVYYENLAYFLHFHGQKTAVVLPNKMKNYFKSLNIKTKTDKVDSRIIALYGIERSVDLWEPMSENFKNIRDLCRELLSMKKELQRAKNQLHAIKYAHNKSSEIKKLKESQIAFFEKSIQKLRKTIEKTVKNDIPLEKKIQKIITIPGMGFETAVILASETNGFLMFENIRQVVSYSGLDVSHNESGNFKGRSKISKKGNSKIRQALYMPALSATSANEPIKALYKRIVEKNPQTKRVGVVAAMRKLLVLAFSLWKKDEVYDKAYVWNA